MKILITGGAGFIGFHTARALLERGDEVTVIDNFNDYYDPRIKEARFAELKKINSTIRLHRIDLADYEAVKNIFKDEKIDKVCHLAAQAGVRYSLTNPLVYEQSNIRGTLHILELCRHYSIRDLVYASSSSVYGNNQKLPFSEKDRTDHPISLYAASKKSNEEMAFTYHHLFGLHTTGLRFFTVYGPWGRPDMAMFLFADAIAKNKPIGVFNHGRMRRDFTYIDDIVSGVIASIDKAYPNEIFNLARGESVELTDYIMEIEKHLGKRAEMNMLPIQAGDVPVTSADISHAKEMLGYSPQTSIALGISNFIEWYKTYYH